IISKKREGQDTVAVVAPSTLPGFPEEATLDRLRACVDEVIFTPVDNGERPDISHLETQFRGARNIKGLARSRSCHRTIVFDAKGQRVRGALPDWVLSDQL